jgi:hypothetical protein
MSRPAKSLSVGADNSLHLSLGVLALCFPLPEIQQIIDSCGKASRRIRDLPAAVVAFYVIAISLYPSVGYEAVLRWLLCGLQWLGSGTFRVSGKASLSRARQRLGEEAMRCIFEQKALPLANPLLKGSYWKGFHVVAVDGSTLALQDTSSNREAFGKSSNQNGEGIYPMARCVVLTEVGTHVIFDARIGAYKECELRLAEPLLAARLRAGMLCLADRLFTGHALWGKAAATGAHLVWRAKTGFQLTRIKSLPDGSWLARWKSSDRGNKIEHEIRVVEYRLGNDSKAEVHRLHTTLLDPSVASAEELAMFYPERWEVELCIKESKSVLRQNQLTLRSKVAAMVRQEFWGLLLAHYIVRKMMAQAALERGVDPDKLSFKSSVEIIKAAQTGPALSFPP